MGRLAGTESVLKTLARLLVVAAALAGCDKSPPIPNAAPVVTAVDAVACADRTCEVVFRLVDGDADPIDLEATCERASGACTLTGAPGTDGLVGLQPDRQKPGRSHYLRVRVDGPSTSEEFRLRLVPTDARGLVGAAVTSQGFTLAEGF